MDIKNERAESPVATRVCGRAGHIILNRPHVINALNQEMIDRVRSILKLWKHDDSVKTVVLTGRGMRGLCAGGDIADAYSNARSGAQSSAEFWEREYTMVSEIAEYPKPVVAIMDGIVLGGGVGISGHARIRVVTEHSLIGMPETTIGYFPDVGATYLLARAPGELGTHLALTAQSVDASDAIYVGLADHYVRRANVHEFITRLASEPAPDAMANMAEEAPAARLPDERAWIDEAYAGGNVATITQRLRKSNIDAGRHAFELLSAKSPTALKVTLRAVRNAAALPALRDVLDQDYRLTVRLHDSHDFIEGVRAQVIDKDRQPRWRPDRLAGVDDAKIGEFFTYLESGELGLGTGRSRDGFRQV